MSKYGTTPEQYKEIFAKKAKEQITLLQELERICHDAGVELKNFTDRFIWNFFQDIIYDTDDEARIFQKKTDPEGYKESEGYLADVLSPTKEDIMNEVKSLRELFEFKFGKIYHPDDQS